MSHDNTVYAITRVTENGKMRADLMITGTGKMKHPFWLATNPLHRWRWARTSRPVWRG